MRYVALLFLLLSACSDTVINHNIPALCGNGIVEDDEACDGGNEQATDVSEAEASFEECDDGQLMASHYTQAKSQFVCVAGNPTVAGSATNHDGALWIPAEVECGSLNCGATGYRKIVN